LNLTKGLILVTLSAFIVVINAAVNKEVVTTFESVIMFAAISHLGTAPLGLLASYIMNRGEARRMSRFNVNPGLLRLSIACGIVQFASFAAFLFAFAEGGPLAIVYTVHSLYILIPIVLSIIFFNEHWNMRKVAAIAASIAALVLLR
jgi:drug/metabolite transporter (DMT)-like permease